MDTIEKLLISFADPDSEFEQQVNSRSEYLYLLLAVDRNQEQSCNVIVNQMH